MLSHRLRRFPLFATLSPDELNALSARVRPLSLPAGRWLVRPGRELPGSYFLDRGRVRLYDPDGTVDAGSERALHALYPGARGVATVTAVELLQVDADALAGLFAAPDQAPPLYESTWLTEGWESRFLGAHLMQRLRPCHWQRILRALRPVALAAGEPVISEGEAGGEFYVLCTGSAEVRAAGRCVARLEPGDCFGADALITGAPRNANVVMVANGSVRTLSDALFRSLLLPVCVVPEGSEEPLRLDIGPTAHGVGLHVPLADLRERVGELRARAVYCIAGGSAAQRLLAAFILSQHGLRVVQLAD